MKTILVAFGALLIALIIVCGGGGGAGTSGTSGDGGDVTTGT